MRTIALNGARIRHPKDKAVSFIMAFSLWVWKSLYECETWRPSELPVAVKERVIELARMLGGQNDGARKHAEALLK